MASKKELYALTKEMLYAKFGGVCAFCGHQLGERWHIWEINPSKTVVTYRGEIILGDESYENKLPACISCNTSRNHGSKYKSDGRKLNVEEFREHLYHEFDFMTNYSMTATYFKRLIKYGLLKETGEKIVFHFEKHPNV